MSRYVLRIIASSIFFQFLKHTFFLNIWILYKNKVTLYNSNEYWIPIHVKFNWDVSVLQQSFVEMPAFE